MRILLLNPNFINRHNWGHQLFKNEFARQHDVVYYGQGFKGFKESLTIPQVLKKNKPFDIILTYEMKWSRHFKGLDKITDIPKVHIQIDYSNPNKNWNGFSTKENVNRYFRLNNYDLYFVTSSSNVQLLKTSMGIENVFMLPFSVDINRYKNKRLKRNIDVMATFNTNKKVYPLRGKIQKLLHEMPISEFTGRILHEGYINQINKSKIFVISNNFNKRLSMKYTEAMACGAMVLADRPEDLRLQGFKNGKHLVIYDGLKDLRKKIKYYLENNDERERIAKVGMKFVRKDHSCEKRVKQFTEIVKRELGI